MNNKFLNLIKPYDICEEEKNIFFVHLPKCGGTTIDHIFLRFALSTKNFARSRMKDNFDNIDEIKNNINKMNNKFFFTGHLNENFFDNLEKKPLKVTIIRNPIARIISHYKFSSFRKGLDIKKYSLEDYFNENYIKFEDNIVVRILSNTKNKDQIIGYKEVEIAVKNLEKFYLYADFSEWEEFTRLLISVCKFPNLLYAKFQKKNYPFNYILNGKDLELIKRKNKFDIKLYNLIFNKQKIFSKISLSGAKKKISDKFLLVSLENIKKNGIFIFNSKDLDLLKIKIISS